MPKVAPSLGPLAASLAPVQDSVPAPESVSDDVPDDVPDVPDDSPPAQAPDPAHDGGRVAYFTKVVIPDPESTRFFGKIRKVGAVYYVPFEHPFRVQTPVMKLTYLDDRTAKLKMTKTFAQFASSVETFVLRAAIAHRREWFRKDMPEEGLRASFKSFVRGCEFEARVDEEFVAFDSEGDVTDPTTVAGSKVGARCILELSGVCFGRSEFGGMWSLVQMQTIDPPTCLIEPEFFAGEFQ